MRTLVLNMVYLMHHVTHKWSSAQSDPIVHHHAANAKLKSLKKGTITRCGTNRQLEVRVYSSVVPDEYPFSDVRLHVEKTGRITHKHTLREERAVRVYGQPTRSRVYWHVFKSSLPEEENRGGTSETRTRDHMITTRAR